MRTYDLNKVLSATNQYSEEIKGFYPEDWIKDDKNIALANEDEDIALFEHFKEGVVLGHYFFRSRGKKAVEAAKAFLKEIFTEYAVVVIVGMTPLQNKKAKWMSRHLGFKYQGIVKTEVDPCEIMLMTKADWEKTNE